MGQSLVKVMKILHEFDTDSSLDDDRLVEEVKKAELADYIKDERSFAARKHVVEGSGFENLDIEASVGEGILYSDVLAHKPKVNLGDPDVTIIALLDKDKGYLCVDFSGADLSKRDYRVFTHPSSLKAAVGYAMVKIAVVEEGNAILDPFCGSGTIVMEAAHYLSRKSIHFYNKEKFAFVKFIDYDLERDDKDAMKKIDAKLYAFDNQMRHIKAAEKNAKISGVNTMIGFSRTEVDWLDTKFGEKSVDKILANPPQVSKIVREKDLAALFDEFFYQADYVLKDDGVIVLVSTGGRNNYLYESSSEKKGFVKADEIVVRHGKQDEHLLVFRRK
jgi:23S rRNA G2445 N2-methylase RlmL